MVLLSLSKVSSIQYRLCLREKAVDVIPVLYSWASDREQLSYVSANSSIQLVLSLVVPVVACTAFKLLIRLANFVL
uniref:Ovule protein n=1 Tax=Steinernema glaseri TaxID=37863 RepID=A0A1I7ZK00_9BILA